ncbi:sensor histidine kinase [Phytohabitans flavus]|uniref:sensor histidine kinase n=1 Tax=Phytohabitans flavus TaxID=1076124 RepID=UPI003643AB28
MTDGPIALAGLLAVLLTFTVGVLLVVVVVGVPVLAAGVVAARGWARFERARARVLLGERVPDPPTVTAVPRLADLTDAAGWRAVLYLLVKAPLAGVTSALAICVYGGAGQALTYPLWFSRTPMVFGMYTLDTLPSVLAVVLIGLVLLFAGGWLLLGPLALSRLAVRGLLGPSRLAGRIRALEQARGQAVDASAATLRQIERDLHDGTQARLVTLAMDLGHARELLGDVDDGGPAATRLRATVEAAHRNAQQAVVELRHLVQNIHPPVLDTGLEPALRSLTEALTVPVTLRVELAGRPPPAVETIAYFCAVELLGNMVKHSGADAATVDVTGDRAWMTLRVRDDGTGGAAVRGGVPGGGGTGLAGLAARIGTVDGTLQIDSPSGGPTVVTIGLPMTI